MSNFKMLVAEQKDLAGRIGLLADELAKAVKENKERLIMYLLISLSISLE